MQPMLIRSMLMSPVLPNAPDVLTAYSMLLVDIPLIWAIYADVADYSEWKTGRRFTGIVFATIGFALKSGLAIGNSSFLWIMAGFFNYDTKQPDAPQAVSGFRVCSTIIVGILFAICTLLLIAYQLNKKMTIQIADELAERRKKFAATTSIVTTP